jgi:hypothetical protein
MTSLPHIAARYLEPDTGDQADAPVPFTWPRALLLGLGAALLHRLALMSWVSIAWQAISHTFAVSIPNFHGSTAVIPPLHGVEQLVFGVWRRWDVIHYFSLATNGYTHEDVGASVFGPVTPVLFRVADSLLPGGLDFAAAVVQTLALGVALAFLLRWVQGYFADVAVARWAVVVLLVSPVSFFLVAPLSESLFLVWLSIWLYAVFRRRWWIAGLAVMLAVLTRTQGLVLVLITPIFYLEQFSFDYAKIMKVPRRILLAMLPLMLPVAAFLAFDYFRTGVMGYPTLTETYQVYSYNYFTNPVDAFIINVRWFLRHPLTIDVLALFLIIALSIGLLARRETRRLPLLAFVCAHLYLFLSKVNLEFGSYTELNFTQSVARYALTLLPLFVLLACFLRDARPWQRLLYMGTSCLLLALLSGLWAVALAGP